MTQGVLLFAFNKGTLDYVKQAIFCAKRIKKHMELPVALVTDSKKYLIEKFPYYKKYIDVIIEKTPESSQEKTYRDGLYHSTTLRWNNIGRCDAYQLSPFDETIVMDTDVVVCNNILLNCFKSNKDLLVTKNYKNILLQKSIDGLDYVSETSFPMYWATLFYFKKTENTKLFFDIIKNIQQEWSFYRLIYGISERKFRNDYAFSIALYIIKNNNNYQWGESMPGTLWTSTDKDLVCSIDDDKIILLAHKDYDYLGVCLQGANTHIMNKFSLERVLESELADE